MFPPKHSFFNNNIKIYSLCVGPNTVLLPVRKRSCVGDLIESNSIILYFPRKK